MSEIVTKPLNNTSNECILCAHSNDEEYFDTGRYLDAPVPLKETGRKYVCRSCVVDAAHAFGFATPEELQVLLDKIAEQKLDIDSLTEEARLSEAVQEAASFLKVKKIAAKATK